MLQQYIQKIPMWVESVVGEMTGVIQHLRLKELSHISNVKTDLILTGRDYNC
jgi:hypothetical protein